MSKYIAFDYEKTESKFDLTFRPVTRTVFDFKEEVLNTARTIYHDSDKPLMLCFSGGIDSEVVARALIELDIDFTCLIVRHNEGTNDYDVHHALKFCKEYSIKYIKYDIDFHEFMKVKVFEYIEQGFKVATPLLFLINLLEIVDSLGFTAILGLGEHEYYNINDNPCLIHNENYTILLDWMLIKNKKHFPHFFNHNPEIVASYIQTDLMKFLLKNPKYFSPLGTHYLNQSVEKILIYHNYWHNMARRSKFGGFEDPIIVKLINDLNLKLDNKLAGYTKRKVILTIDQIKSQLNIV